MSRFFRARTKCFLHKCFLTYFRNKMCPTPNVFNHKIPTTKRFWLKKSFQSKKGTLDAFFCYFLAELYKYQSLNLFISLSLGIQAMHNDTGFLRDQLWGLDCCGRFLSQKHPKINSFFIFKISRIWLKRCTNKKKMKSKK